jgi:hypothetical protein
MADESQPGILSSIVGGVGSLISPITGIFSSISENKRKNRQQEFEQKQADLLAAYNRDKETTLTFEQWALQNQNSNEQFNLAIAGNNTTQYIVAAVVILVAGISLVYLNKNDN